MRAILLVILSGLLISASARMAAAQNGSVNDINNTHITVGEINRVHYENRFDIPGVVRVDGLSQQIQNVNRTHITVGDINRASQINFNNSADITNGLFMGN